MESNDLSSKKTNNKQNSNEGSNGDNVTKNTNPDVSHLKSEVETDTHGNKKIVQRARNIEGNLEQNEDTTPVNLSSDTANVSEELAKKMVENKDHNSDLTANRYPNSHPDNKEDRGNIKLDE
ncbi:hypothetical protein [Flavobacterium caseinilyticum]|uniref:Uncharacterized protein n=1 Tax=Flavobacterium caseinilyticum TaxID=2541732 RepID=A0A4R5ATD7_9FLAO|nr:hypothetical protein [Flavobacterium caseinilyticum]TDD75250.1 hypothetical protein E0F89_12785 [Flavobacterium caseinilyticum]